MAIHSFSDGELLQIMRTEEPTASNRAYVQLSEDPSVKTAIEALLQTSESKNVAVAYLQLRVFQSLTSIVQSKKFGEKQQGEMLLRQAYVRIFGNMLTAEPIRTRQEPQSDRLLKGLFRDETVLNTIKKMVKDYAHLDARDVLDRGFSAFYEAIFEQKYNGQATLRTYLIGICKMLILGSGSSGTIKTESGGETKQVKRVSSTDSFDFIENDVGFSVELEDKSDEQQLLERIVDQALNSNDISDECKEALVLQYGEGLPMAQIAEIMGIAYQSAKNQAVRCRNKLWELIEFVGGVEAFLKESFNIKKKKDSGN
jgi:RNA polymerase sigma factor (sigma-70 family)